MKLQYTEHRTTVNSDTVEVSPEFTDEQGFGGAVIKEVATCLDFEAIDVAHKLIDWYQKVRDQGMLKPGTKLVHNYGGGLDPIGTWEIIESPSDTGHASEIDALVEESKNIRYSRNQ